MKPMEGILYNPGTPEIWTANAVLRGRSKVYGTPTMQGTLSIKTVRRGHARWSTPERTFRVDEDAFLVLNEGQTYSLEIDCRDWVETHCVFFRPGFFQQASAARDSSWESLLESEGRVPGDCLECLNPMTRGMRMALEQVQESLSLEPGSQFDSMVAVADALKEVQDSARHGAARLDHARESTREEVHRRLVRTRDRILSDSSGDISLAALARDAAMSPFHFHRLFTRVFGETPHALITKRKLAHAGRLLKAGMPVWQVCHAVGFQSPTSFAAAFKKAFGISPKRYALIPQD